MNRVLYILIGPKGSGKTHIGSLAHKNTDIYFLRVEPIWLELKKDQNGWEVVENKIDELFESKEKIMIESLGAGDGFNKFHDSLAAKYSIKKIRVFAKPETCLSRVRTRDSSDHIPLSDDKVIEYNQIASKVVFPWALEIENEMPASDSEILDSLNQL